ncbi:MAG: diaminobutyrate acetyltransferase [Acidobacteria bacterium]|nr:diaminobutyrate acetyltransferase [Acidobacteriota bacterium]
MSIVLEEPTAGTGAITLRLAEVGDGAALWRLVRDSRVLDLNSPYSYLLLCHKFGDTCLVAESEGEVAGFVTAFRPPDAPDTVFVWQVGVAAQARGRGIAGRLLERLVELPACRDARWLETTVTPDNAASEALFASFARRLGAGHDVRPYFDRDHFPGDDHQPERLHRIGPLSPAS